MAVQPAGQPDALLRREMGARPVWRWALLASLALHALLLFGWPRRPPPPAAAALTLRLTSPPGAVAAAKTPSVGGPAPSSARPAAKAGSRTETKAEARPSAKPRGSLAASPSLPAAGGVPATEAAAAGGPGARSGTAAPSGGGASQAGADSVALYRAEYLNNPQPEYPERSRENGEQGTVLLRVEVGAAGRAGEVAVASSSGYPRLDRAAKAAVERWRFAPARRNGQAVDSVLMVPVRFQGP
ncbi:energy transducer TonB [Chromobacterium sp. LK11]|uniref:energy transducer TonB n=1 Tax=Chromobacterium sp. LK11 TaxID=1628212 RepID=UPI0012E19813|nr:energy transducer TonB [Chromobacterium sp. LK11]